MFDNDLHQARAISCPTSMQQKNLVLNEFFAMGELWKKTKYLINVLLLQLWSAGSVIC